MLAVAGVSLLAALAVSAVYSEPVTHTVTIENMRFDPESLSVKRGDSVVWVNKDLFPHTATADGKAFDSGDIAVGKSWTYVVAAPGRYTYTCSYHPSMKGTLIVQ
jgi:plastocyanin